MARDPLHVRYHGKWLCDRRFGGYQRLLKQADIFGLDCMGRCIEGNEMPNLADDDDE